MNEDVVIEMQKFGELLGIAFQIKDDLLDYQVNNKTGKPTGNDLQESKLTLPLIYALEKANPSEKKHILRLMHSNNNEHTKKSEIRTFINKHRGLEYAGEKMTEFADLALQKLADYPDNDISTSLHQFVKYTIYRNK
jgi:octaprenyl-diphosphate synthase